MAKKNYPCPVCGHRTLESLHDWDICPVCFWEDDVDLLGREDASSPANGMTVSEAQANFILYGVCKLQYKGNVRPPMPKESRNPH